VKLGKESLAIKVWNVFKLTFYAIYWLRRLFILFSLSMTSWRSTLSVISYSASIKFLDFCWRDSIVSFSIAFHVLANTPSSIGRFSGANTYAVLLINSPLVSSNTFLIWLLITESRLFKIAGMPPELIAYKYSIVKPMNILAVSTLF